jgi:2-aminoadipate transaminase
MQSLPQSATADTISLLLGHPDPTTLFTPEFQAAVERTLALPQALTALQYGNEQGNLALIDYLVGKINRDQGLGISSRQLMITGGSTHAVDLVARLYTRPGGAVIVEAPTYADSLHIFRDHGIELHGVPLDEQGARVDELEKLLTRLSASDNPAKLFYTIPNFHNPTGITLSQQRRVEIVRLARQYNLMLVEDDVYRDLAFEADIPPSLFALTEGVNAIHIGSFSKTLAPGLRLGWLTAAPETVQRFVNCGTTQMGGGASPFTAQILAEYCRSGCWEPHIEHLRRLYQSRRDIMLTALERWMPAGVTWTQPDGGFFIWLTLPDDLQARDIKQQARARGVMVAAGEGYFLDPADGAHHLRLTYSFAPPSDIERAVRILAEVIGSSG